MQHEPLTPAAKQRATLANAVEDGPQPRRVCAVPALNFSEPRSSPRLSPRSGAAVCAALLSTAVEKPATGRRRSLPPRGSGTDAGTGRACLGTRAPRIAGVGCAPAGGVGGRARSLRRSAARGRGDVGRPSPVFGRRFGLRDLEPEPETTMTDERMALIELVEKEADADLVREMLAFAAERIMDAEVEARDRRGEGRAHAAAGDPAQRLSRARSGRRAPAGSSWRSRSCGRAPTSRASSSRAGRPRRRSWR